MIGLLIFVGKFLGMSLATDKDTAAELRWPRQMAQNQGELCSPDAELPLNEASFAVRHQILVTPTKTVLLRCSFQNRMADR